MALGSWAIVVHVATAHFLVRLALLPPERAPVAPGAGPSEPAREPPLWRIPPTVADTCPADCPAPSLAFCGGPLLELVESFGDYARNLVNELRAWVPLAAFGCACVAFGFGAGRATGPAAAAPAPRQQTDVVRGPAAERQHRRDHSLAVGGPRADDR